jgi:hypothetical protein
LRIAVFGPVQDKLRLGRAVVVEAQIVEEQMPPSIGALAPKKAGGNDLIGVDIGHGQGRSDGVQWLEGFHVTASS